MNRSPLFIALLSAILVLSGCGGGKITVQSPPASSYHFKEPDQYQKTISKLYTRLDEWQGVPHRDNGMSKKGVDCSGFTYLTYRELFDIRLPRTTSQLSHSGIPVSKGQLQPGDLVFFKVEKGRHVGIYVEKQKFIHASKSKGVMMSRLDNPYWQQHYWQARRVASL